MNIKIVVAWTAVLLLCARQKIWIEITSYLGIKTILADAQSRRVAVSICAL